MVPARRGSASHARRSALANALNVASTMWCEFLPASCRQGRGRGRARWWAGHAAAPCGRAGLGTSSGQAVHQAGAQRSRGAKAACSWHSPGRPAGGARQRGPAPPLPLPRWPRCACLADVQRHARGVGQGLEEVLHQLRLVPPYPLRGQVQVAAAGQGRAGGVHRGGRVWHATW